MRKLNSGLIIRCREAPHSICARLAARPSNWRFWATTRAAAVLTLGVVLADPLAAEKEAAARPFTPLHIYYISPHGSDQNPGTSPDAAWSTPRHNVNCGDVIIAEAGRYIPGQYGSVFGANNWGAVSNCPSTSGGIDGKGGIYFATLLCAGPNMSSCPVSGGPSEAFRVDRSHWAVEGFMATQSAKAGNGCITATSETNEVIAFVAFVNDIVSTCSVDGLGAYGWTQSGGVDQSAVVGAIAYNAASSLGGGLCGSGVSIIPANGSVETPGTHVFVAGFFGYRNINAPSGAGCNSDGEGLIFDSWSCSGGNNPYAHQGVAEQNVWWFNGNAGFEVFPNCQAKNGDRAKIYVFDNTSVANGQDLQHISDCAELLIVGVSPTLVDGTYYKVSKNIFQATESGCGPNRKYPVYGATITINNTNMQLVNVTDNYIFQSNPGSKTSAGAPNTNIRVNSDDIWSQIFFRVRYKWWGFPFGDNIYRDAGFANLAGLPTDAPICDDYTNTTACMNEGYKVASNLKPSIAVGYGYSPPGPCKPDPYFPFWLKGVVFLRWDGSAVTENPGLITKPCDL